MCIKSLQQQVYGRYDIPISVLDDGIREACVGMIFKSINVDVLKLFASRALCEHLRKSPLIESHYRRRITTTYASLGTFVNIIDEIMIIVKLYELC